MEPNELSGWGKAVDRLLGWAESGASLVAGLLSGHRATRPQRVVASQPVANPDVFEGREADIERLGGLFGSRNVVWVTGAPGIGKSALAGRFLRDKGLADGACSFELGERADLQDLLESISAFLIDKNCPAFDQALRQPGLQPPQRIPALLRALEQTAVVLLIESYEEVAANSEIGELIQQAEERLSGARIIVTSQEPPGWEIAQRQMHLGGLEAEKSRLVLAALGLTEGWQEIHRAVDGCPKGLRVAAGLAKRYGVDVALGAAARGDHPALGLFEEVYGRMTEPVQRMWVMLAILPGPFDKETVLSLWSDQNGAFGWSELVELSVLDARGEGWQMHSLARATGSKKRAGQGGWQKQYGQKIARYYARFAEEKTGDRAAVEGELENLLAAARLASRYKEWEALWGMGYALDEPLDYAGRWTAREELLRLCYEGTVAAAEEGGRANFGHRLGRAMGRRGAVNEAARLYRESLAVWQKLGQTRAVGVLLNELAVVALEGVELAEAEQLFCRSLKIARDLKHRAGEAAPLHGLADIARKRRDSARARRLYAESLEIERGLGNAKGEAATLHQLGVLASEEGDVVEARRMYEESLRLVRELSDRPGEAARLHELGIVAADAGDLVEAERLHLESLAICREVGDRRGEAMDLVNLAQFAEHRGRLEEAEDWYNQSLEIEREVGDRPGEARTLWALAMLAEEQGDLGLAVERMEKAVAMMEEMGMAEAGKARGDLERLRGRVREG